MIPQILESRGILDTLYTDSTSDSTLGKIAKFVNRYITSTESLRRLSNRNTGITPDKVFTNDWLQVKLILNRLLKKSVLSDVRLVFEGSSKCFIRHGIQDVDWLYTMFIENLDFVKYAKSKNIRILADIYENPYIWTELINEIKKPAYKSIAHLQELYEAQAILRQDNIDELLALADKYLVPSQYVKDCLKESPYYDESKVNIIPYASSVKNTVYNNEPNKGRIIWIGNDAVRKGLCYCAEAATLLRQKYDYIDFRIIGPVPTELHCDPFYKDLNFLGYCNKSQLQEEFKVADMFIFPTLAEGFAGVLLEASSFGVPIITTTASGFSNDAPCIFIPKHDTNVIVKEAVRLIEDRDYRNRISHDLFDYSQNLETNQFADKLINLLTIR